MLSYKGCIAIVMTVIASTAYSFAIEQYDCNLEGLIGEGAGRPENIKDKFSYLLDKENLTIAEQNLRAYCCSSKKITDEKICDNADSKNDFPESPYLYDHLVDVAVRRRDGLSDEAYKMKTLDTKTQEYRKYMDEVATTPDGKKPDDIISKIKQRWIPNGKPFVIESYTPTVCSTTDRTELESKTLYEKLSNVCTVARCAYDDITKNMSNKTSGIATDQGYENCQDMISNKIYNEFRYMNSIINQAANRKLQKNLTEYLTNYFARDRLINLQNKIGETYDAFAVVNRFVQEGTKTCSG